MKLSETPPSAHLVSSPWLLQRKTFRTEQSVKIALPSVARLMEDTDILFPKENICVSLSTNQEEKRECGAVLYSGMEAGWLRPAVGRQYPLDMAAQAHHDIIECPGATGKMVLTM